MINEIWTCIAVKIHHFPNVYSGGKKSPPILISQQIVIKTHTK